MTHFLSPSRVFVRRCTLRAPTNEEEMARLVGRVTLVAVLAVPSSMSASFTQDTDCAESSDSASNLPQACVPGSPRLRGSDPAIAAAIEQTLAGGSDSGP